MAETMMARHIRLIGAMALTVVTLAIFSLLDRYDLVQAQILRNANFANGVSDWTVSGKAEQLRPMPGGLVVEGMGKGHATGVRQIVPRPEGAEVLRLTATVRHTGIPEGLRVWHAMRLLMVQRDGAGKLLWELPHVVEQEHGDSPWRAVSLIVRLPQRVASVEVIAVLNQVPGTMEVRDLTLDVMAESGLFLVLRYCLSAAWILAFAWLIWPLLRAGPMRLGRLAVAALATIILVGVMTPHTVKLELRRIAQDLTRPESVPRKEAVTTKIKPPQVVVKTAKPVKAAKATAESAIPISEIWRIVHKFGHVSMFAVLAFIVAITWRGLAWWQLGSYVAVFALTAETLQLLSLDRTAYLLDAGLNLLGAGAGLALATFLIRYREKARAIPINCESQSDSK
ncbi:MAG: hypothetical protein HOK30_04640 [Rhodospirillaceae bacterium]|nr:hypothetical protein [Rhodospirillaceae bacterium]MBT5898880.1 hypothetical protein [Rhodospirillaceae bacterium]MBT6426926.1 hypothetical protein [Rhodospirillaceae bacterium]MBT7757763.1 hypothetical protein [Rhodospirillaceae bacterium]